MAITKERKNELVNQYVEWINQSQAFFVTEYSGLNMKQIDDLRAKARQSGGEFHVMKNTLAEVALKSVGMKLPATLLTGSTAIAFAFKDVPAVAKILSDYARTSEFVKVKGGFLNKQEIRAEDVRSLADLPPLPVVRAQLLGVLNAPASKLARTLAEPGRQIAGVLKAFSEKENAVAEPAAA